MISAASRTVARIRLRRGWTSYAALVVLISLAGGLTLGGIAGARRTATAAERFASHTNAYDVLVNPDIGDESELDFDDVAALPMVEQAAKVDGSVLIPPGPVTIESIENWFGAMAIDDAIYRDISVPRIDDGSMPDPEDPLAVSVTRSAAAREGWEAGDELAVRIPSREDIEQLYTVQSQEELDELLAAPGYAPEATLRIDAVVATLDDLVAEEGLEGPGIHVSRALWDQYGEPAAGWWGALITLKDPGDVDAFRGAVQELVPEETVVFQTGVTNLDRLDRISAPFAVALAIFALVAAVLGLLLIGQAISRRLRAEARDNETWSSMGATRGDRAAMSMWTVAALSVAGSLGAVLVAIALSPLTPLGPGRDAEPDPGVAIDGWVLALGAVGLAIAVVVVALIPAWRAAAPATRTAGVTRPPAALRLSRLSRSASVSTGVRYALDPGRGATSVPTRSTLIGAASGVAIAVVVVVIAASLNHLVATPKLFGSDWDATISFSGADVESESVDTSSPQVVADALDEDPAVVAWSPIEAAQVEIDGRAVQALAFLGSNAVEPTIAAGRAPAGADEIALGQLTMDELGVGVGDVVNVAGADGSVATATVVGRAILPAVAQYSGSDKTSLGEGAVLGDHGADYLEDMIDATTAVKLSPGESAAALADRLNEQVGDAGVVVSASDVAQPSDIKSMADLRGTPISLAALLLVLIAFAVCHALFVAARSRRHELGILQALGATPGDVRMVLVVQALTVGVIACLAGLLGGLIVANWSWRMLMDSFGALAEPTAAPLLIVGVLAAVVVLALLASLWPARQALRVSPAKALSTE